MGRPRLSFADLISSDIDPFSHCVRRPRLGVVP